MLTKDQNALYRSSNGTQSRNRRQSMHFWHRSDSSNSAKNTATKSSSSKKSSSKQSPHHKKTSPHTEAKNKTSTSQSSTKIKLKSILSSAKNRSSLKKENAENQVTPSHEKKKKVSSKSTENLDCLSLSLVRHVASDTESLEGTSNSNKKIKALASCEELSSNHSSSKNASMSLSKMSKMASLDDEKLIGNGGVINHKEFSKSKYHEVVSKTFSSSTNKLLLAGNSKVTNSTVFDSFDSVSGKKAVVATKSWAGCGDGGSNYRISLPDGNVSSTRSFSSGLCSIMASDGNNTSHPGIQSSSQLKTFFFDPVTLSSVDGPSHRFVPPVGGPQCLRSASLSGFPCHLQKYGGCRSGPVSLDANVRSTESFMRPSYHDHHQAPSNAMSVSQQALCEQCFVGNLSKQQIKYQQAAGHRSSALGTPKCQKCRHEASSGYASAKCCPSSHYRSYTEPKYFVGGGALCRCNSDVSRGVSANRSVAVNDCMTVSVNDCISGSNVAVNDCISGSNDCSACYVTSCQYPRSHPRARHHHTASTTCMNEYNDYMDYTQSPYASQSPYQRKGSPYASPYQAKGSPYSGSHHSPYTAHYDTPPLSSHSPPIADSPSHSYYSPSESYTTPPENLKLTTGAAIFHHKLNMSSVNSSLSVHTTHSKDFANNSSRTNNSSSSGFRGICSSVSCMCDKCGYPCSDGLVCGNVDGQNSSCGEGICCTTVGRVPNNTSMGHHANSKQHGDVRYTKHFMSSSYIQDGAKPSRQMMCHPNWKSTDGAHEMERQKKMTASLSEGLLCTEL